MKKILFLLFILVSSVCFGQREIHGKWKITRLYIGDSTRNLPGTKALRYNPATDEVTYSDTSSSAGGALTSTYIGYGNGSNVLTGTSDFIHNSSSEVILNSTDQGAYKFQVAGNMYLGNSTGVSTSTPEKFNMGGTVSDDYTDATKLKLQMFNNGSGISGIGVANDGAARVISYMVETSGGRHEFFVNGTSRVQFSSSGISLPFSGAVLNFNSGNATITHSTGLLTSNVQFAVPDDAYDASTWNASVNVPTKNAVRDKIILMTTQGADVASLSGAIALGSDGTSFEITGTNAITLISNVGWHNGDEVMLFFTSTATLTDGTANSGTDIGMELSGNINFSASADDVVTLVLCEIGGVQRWREKSRSVN